MTITQFTHEFEAAMPQLKSYLFRIATSIEDTEDIIQDTFIKASLKLDSFRGESTVKTWIFTIASNIAKDNLRAKKKDGLKKLLTFVEKGHWPTRIIFLKLLPSGKILCRLNLKSKSTLLFV